jgi:hypothetical protein
MSRAKGWAAGKPSEFNRFRAARAALAGQFLPGRRGTAIVILARPDRMWGANLILTG